MFFTPSLSFRSLAVLTTLVASNPCGIYAKAVPPSRVDARQLSASSASSAPGSIQTVDTSLPNGPVVATGFQECKLFLNDTISLGTHFPHCEDLVHTLNNKIPDLDDYTIDDFYAANPEINDGCTNFKQGYNYCLDAPDKDKLFAFEFLPVPANNTLGLGSNPNCSEYVVFQPNDKCETLGAKYKFSEAQFALLNPQAGCDSFTAFDFACVRPIKLSVYTPDMCGFVANQLRGASANGVSSGLPWSQTSSGSDTRATSIS
ncbi:hypothetical protein C8R43DRAFT_1018980 [Mycena crocata]|nr:hypothetical protein C8R43DRAFT_1018980 [Mycena crocata]